MFDELDSFVLREVCHSTKVTKLWGSFQGGR
jgi:hypothetical protein